MQLREGGEGTLRKVKRWKTRATVKPLTNDVTANCLRDESSIRWEVTSMSVTPP